MTVFARWTFLLVVFATVFRLSVATESLAGALTAGLHGGEPLENDAVDFGSPEPQEAPAPSRLGETSAAAVAARPRHANAADAYRLRFRSRGIKNFFKTVVNAVRKPKAKPAQQPAPQAQAQSESSSANSPSIPKRKWSQEEVEDCVGCRFIWTQIESEVGVARSVEAVQSAFEHNCIDAQRTAIFYRVCSDMYDDIFAMVDEYMSNQWTVLQLCERAKMCPTDDPPARVPLTCSRYWETRGCGSSSPGYLRRKVAPWTECTAANCARVCCVKPPPSRALSEFEVHVHYKNGYDEFQLFDYGKKALAKESYTKNAGQYSNEYKNFPDAWATLLKRLTIDRSKLPEDLELTIAGYASISGDNKLNYKLSERRAKGFACYLAEWLKRQNVKNVNFRIGFFGESRPSGTTKLHEAHDRRVEIFHRSNVRKNEFFCPKLSWSTARGRDGSLQSYCGQTKNWKNSDFDASWLTYRGNALPPGPYPATRASLRFAPKPVRVLGRCQYKDLEGTCVAKNDCGAASFSSKQGARGCERFPMHVQCCVFTCSP